MEACSTLVLNHLRSAAGPKLVHQRASRDSRNLVDPFMRAINQSTRHLATFNSTPALCRAFPRGTQIGSRCLCTAGAPMQQACSLKPTLLQTVDPSLAVLYPSSTRVTPSELGWRSTRSNHIGWPQHSNAVVIAEPSPIQVVLLTSRAVLNGKKKETVPEHSFFKNDRV